MEKRAQELKDLRFSLDAGPDYEGKLREIDVKTLQEVGRMIHEKNIIKKNDE
jgi:hypothetical protein